MSNKTLEQAISTEAQLNSDKELDLAGFRTRQEHRICAFKAGAQFILSNLNLLSPSDVAKIPVVVSLIGALNLIRDNPNATETMKLFIDHALENFEPKKEGANE